MSKFIKTSFRINCIFFIRWLAPFIVILVMKDATANCQLRKEHSYYVFSGSVAATMYRLGLLNDPSIRGMLSSYEFSPTRSQKFAAGIYLSQKKAESIEDNAIIFLEESKDLEQTLDHVASRKNKKWLKLPVISKGLSPLKVSRDALKVIMPYLEKGKQCFLATQKYLKNIDAIEKKLFSSENVSGQQVYFFMGQWKNNFPENTALVIFQEGFIKDLISAKRLKPYTVEQHETNYASWSAKQITDPSLVWIGITSNLKDKNHNYQLQKISQKRFQVHCFACLIPGIFQLEWLEKLIEEPLFNTK